jgi:hypothetical protein
MNTIHSLDCANPDQHYKEITVSEESGNPLTGACEADCDRARILIESLFFRECARLPSNWVSDWSEPGLATATNWVITAWLTDYDAALRGVVGLF